MNYYLSVIKTSEFTREQLEAVHRGLVQERLKVEELIQEIDNVLSDSEPTPVRTTESTKSDVTGTPKKKRKMSRSGRKRIAEAMRRRWAASRSEATTAQAKASKKTSGQKRTV